MLSLMQWAEILIKFDTREDDSSIHRAKYELEIYLHQTFHHKGLNYEGHIQFQCIFNLPQLLEIIKVTSLSLLWNGSNGRNGYAHTPSSSPSSSPHPTPSREARPVKSPHAVCSRPTDSDSALLSFSTEEKCGTLCFSNQWETFISAVCCGLTTQV